MMVYEMNKEDAPAMVKLMKENEAVKRAFFPGLRVFFSDSFQRASARSKI